MAPRSSSTAPEMRTTAPTLSSRAGLEGFTVTAAYACGRPGEDASRLRAATAASGRGWEWGTAAPGSSGRPVSPRSPRRGSLVLRPGWALSKLFAVQGRRPAGVPCRRPPPPRRPLLAPCPPSSSRASGDAPASAPAPAWGATPSPHLGARIGSHLPSSEQIVDPGRGSPGPRRPGGRRAVLTGGLQNSASSGPTRAMGTLSEFSVMTAAAGAGHREARLAPWALACGPDVPGISTRGTRAHTVPSAWAGPELPTPPGASPLPCLPSPAPEQRWTPSFPQRTPSPKPLVSLSVAGWGRGRDPRC